MRAIIKNLIGIFLGTIILLILWMISLGIAEQLIPSRLDTNEVPEAVFFVKFLMVCLIHTILLYVTVRLSGWKGIKLALVIFLLIFIIQYFLSMIEAIWFNNSLNMPLSGIKSILLSGFILALFFSPVIVWIGGGYKSFPQKEGILSGDF
jgi:hypothetical protein